MVRRRDLIEPRRRIATLAIALVGVLGVGVRPTDAVDLTVPGLEAVTLHGFYKNFFLAFDSTSSLFPGGVQDHNRARLMLEGKIRPTLDFAVHYEHQATINPSEAGTGLFLGNEAESDHPGIWPLSWTIISNDDVFWRHEIDRLYLHQRLPWGGVTVGRQAIGWGVGIIWSPQDLFVGFSPAQLDREFRVGVDAVRLRIAPGPFSEAEVVYAVFDQDIDEQSALARWRKTFTGIHLDAGLIAGKSYNDAVVGGLLVSEVAGVGVHAEGTLTYNFGGAQERVGRHHFIRAVAGADYRFPQNVVVIGEYYFNGFGESDPGDYVEILPSPRFSRGEIFNVGRHYLGFIADWEAHPLVHLAAQGQWNLLDPSALIGPACAVSLADEAELGAGAYFGLGEDASSTNLRSEFGALPNLYYVTVKIYF